MVFESCWFYFLYSRQTPQRYPIRRVNNRSVVCAENFSCMALRKVYKSTVCVHIYIILCTHIGTYPHKFREGPVWSLIQPKIKKAHTHTHTHWLIIYINVSHGPLRLKRHGLSTLYTYLRFTREQYSCRSRKKNWIQKVKNF